ncbi:sigma-70 family RNA polymerase sigma factor [Rhodococcus sp. BP-349]|jgi:RNA polymerase sigma-70 factor (ECF subfamily)|nr:sigma-70 family RNA polymerase sigma factor [Rhodococcus sp. BP-363]MBY6544311.1 sigma-70 family RNA polymerase sigma factor [Rhodococcus sp. BP-369]MBY6563541.1 sigma-70 family RNA polymerase sigma factor [Rhodococcus sp. BP-370]MBY6577833.1 sigma-70 family RNA polymerase sigma factor [Rhodococcus sp. BP-364]MBY6587134.1 sigma-70 family RNA polymerase sigma factor [Rhodococcus sp. BP-358]MBY6591471.1 sigma-70 family RNA polymerase sigma factor [Rhodococcus sp. BP-362]MBY6595195.1 sigma-70
MPIESTSRVRRIEVKTVNTLVAQPLTDDSAVSPAPRPAARSTAELSALLQAVGRGDREAFARFYDATSSRVYGAVLRVLRDRGFSEECVQDVYLEVWQKAPTFSPEQGSPAAWLVTMAHRRAIDRVRSEQSRTDRESKYAMLDAAVGIHDTSDRFLDRRPVLDAMQELSGRQRECLFMAFFEGLTYAEAADRMGVPVSTMKSRIRSALAKMRVDPRVACLAE